jgi:hypothetical protein
MTLKSLSYGLSIAALMAGLAVTGAQAQNTTATGTGTSTSGSASESSSGAIGVTGPRSNNASSNNNLGNSNARSNSSANTNSGAASRSASQGNASNQNITFQGGGASTSANSNNNRDAISYSGGTSNSNWNSGDTTIRTTPTVYAPPVSGGNPCTLAVSGGVSVIGWGAAAGGTFVDEACATRQKIAMIHNAGYAGAAKELMCDDRSTYFAFRTAGQPCAYRAAFEGGAPQPGPMVQQQPGPVVVTPASTAPVGAPIRAAGPMPSAQTLPRCKGPNDQGPCFSG